MEYRGPRRLIVALLIATTGLTAAVATGSAVETSDLPGSFQPASPVPGESATYQFVRLDAADQIVAGPLPAFQQTSLGRQWTLDTHGEPAIAEVVERRNGGYVQPGTSRTSYHPDDDAVRMPWSWGQVVQEATDAAGRLIWFSSSAEEVSVDNTTTMLVVPAQIRRDDSRDYVHFADRNSRFLPSCLGLTLPERVPLDRPFQAGDPRMDDAPFGGACTLETPWLDERHPGFTTGKQIHERTDRVGGVMIQPRLHAVAGVQTAYGEGVLFRYAPEQSGNWEVLFAYVPEIPYPVWVSADDAKAATRDVIFLEEYRRPDAPDDPLPPRPAGAPPLAWTPPRPWGMDDAGVDLPLLPSDAWAAALETEPLAGPSPLAAFLAAHPDAYTESAQTHVEWMQGSLLPGDERFRWDFQVRGGDERIAFRVREGANPWGGTLPASPAPLEVEYVEPVEPRWTLPGPPDTVPTMASIAGQFDHWTGLGQPTQWRMEPGCDKRVPVQCEPGQLGPAVRVGAQLVHGGQSIDPEGPALRMDTWSSGAEVSWLPDGRVDAISTHATASQLTTAPTPPADGAPTAVEVVPPSTGYARAASYSIGAAGLIIALLYYFWPALKALPAPLFSRVQAAKVLDHPSRTRLLEAIEQDPGIHQQELVRVLGRGQGAAEHHLRKLVETEHVRRRSTGGFTCYFPKHTDRRIVAAAPALRSATSRRVLASTAAGPSSAAQIARDAGIARSSASHHLARLVEAQVIERQGQGHRVTYQQTALGRELARRNGVTRSSH